MQNYLARLLLASSLVFTFCLESATAQPTVFTYQGRLTQESQAATGLYDFQLALFPNASTKFPVAGPVTNTAVAVSDGLFTTALDFEETVFGQSELWLQIAVRSNGVGAFTAQSPRQRLTAAPWAIRAGGLLPGAALGTQSNTVSFLNPANQFSGSGAGLTGLNASELGTGTVPDARLSAGVARTNQVWLLAGNSGTSPGTHFLGTTDDQSLEFRVNNLSALRLVPNTNRPNVIAGFSGNLVDARCYGSTIGGGGGPSDTNAIYANYATIGGGRENLIGTNAMSAAIGGGAINTIADGSGNAVIAGGFNNTINRYGGNSVIAGGEQNSISESSAHATIAGGDHNDINTDADSSVIGGGSYNTISTRAWYATVGGGRYNYIQRQSTNATIAGGYRNQIGTNSTYAAIGGGDNNTVADNAVCATIPGGYFNDAADFAFAAGRRAKANHTGSFVWADSTGDDYASTADNQFRLRASGGVFIQTASSGLNPAACRIESTSTNGVGLFINQGSSDANFVSANTGTGNQIICFNGPGGGTVVFKVDNDGDVTGKTFTPSSDRNLKENFTRVDPAAVLDQVAALPISRWNFKQDDTTHIGPMAQDFHAAFGVGPDEKHIATVDADGVALAAIQGLNQKLEARNAALEKQVAELKALVQILADKVNGGAQ